MSDSVAEVLRNELECEGLLECFHGLNSLDERCFRTIAESDEPLTVDEIADRVDRERSTVYRSIQRLYDAGFLRKEQINYDQGGYYHVYRPAEPERIASNLRRMLNDWYAQMGQLIHEFETEYGRREGAGYGRREESGNPEDGTGSDRDVREPYQRG
ncbi:TrmB family transcriptional regulator [Halalkaliarchaeum desulfuricum]|uniref:TrmB family transcriptional regulator n=1 Tax=Halalkaliarchaeum desulfuricum TaxID=2055893 RepID=A0A343TF83_9EURY|nr:helix-turn-helix domain-containing protein [Halalkaliarchaeum desulfuricum]AUX07755.1 TrmB family transcriptional regulator [Halalkaliarchaeum desulfuricum]